MKEQIAETESEAETWLWVAKVVHSISAGLKESSSLRKKIHRNTFEGIEGRKFSGFRSDFFYFKKKNKVYFSHLP